ncbi:hypothetical protein DAEQUDRAFT_731228 [Daedalea quercina L-15889]|uniref:mRNA decay factor PAT1 domain-containing protein n=1 Tax=Daedalea quercina L-15889 TaxID=1314783 RepID=A0A165MGS0_9APHY|nr:hypothetical protein DAEQUDRAFT_731228 [Daedalea quercina L-15889]
MSFFGFDNPIDLESEKRKFLEGEGRGPQEDIAVYTWGEQGFDGLGDQLQEGGDELNDETFGGAGEVGKDFDFSQSVLPSDGLHQAAASRARPVKTQVEEQPLTQPAQSSAPSRPTHSLESVWDDKSPFSVLGRMNEASRTAEQSRPSHTPSQSQSFKFSPFGSTGHDAHVAGQSLSGLSSGLVKGAHTLEEVEAEMLAQAALQHQQQQPIAQPSTLAHSQLRGQIPRQGTPQHAASPPPRMHPHSQSPRFHQQQQQHQIHLMHLQQQQQERQLLELARQRERQGMLQEQQLLQQQQQLQLMEQLRLEEIERARQLRLQQMQSANHLHSPMVHQRQSPALSERHPRSLGRQSPAALGVGGLGGAPLDVPFQQSMPYLPQDIQLQQRLLAEMAQAEFLNSMQGGPQNEREVREEHEMQELLRAEAMRKIMEAERSDQKRRRKQAKIQHMSRYNDLMTQSDKDFITRIQVSQLVTQDPYADDFYAQVYGAIVRSRMGVQTQDDRILKFGSGAGVGLGPGQKGSGRRPSAMQRMEAQVERIVNNAKLREKEKISLNSLQGALGKTSGRSYKAAPRQLLQVDASSPSSSPVPSHAHISKADVEPRQSGTSAAHEAAKIGHQALGGAANSDGVIAKDPLTHREALMILERLYDLVLDIEQLRRDQPSFEEDPEAWKDWEADLDLHIERLSVGLRLRVFLETSIPHPFISLLMPIKGKRLLPRVTRYLPSDQILTMVTLIIACFYQLDVVVQSPLLDTLEETKERAELEQHSQVFLSSLVQSVLPAIGKLDMSLVTGLLGMLFKYNDVAAVARTRPGIALLTMFLSRVQNIKEALASVPIGITEPSELPTQVDERRWQEVFDELFHVLAPSLLLLFPSIRISKNSGGIPYGKVPGTDSMDQPVWQFLAAMAVHSSMEQQQFLVTALRELVLENVSSVRRGYAVDEEEREQRMGNVDIFMRALGLDSSQIAV